MERPMTEWNDDRLDELNERVKDGFASVDKRFEQVDKRFEQVASKEEMGEVKFELRRLNDRFDRLLHAMAVSAVGFAGVVLAALAGILVL